MRLWTLHPRYLDPSGLVALWREALLARAVLAGRTRGYRQHPQLQRFRETPDPGAAIDAYLAAVHVEATARGYRFDRSKFVAQATAPVIAASHGQLACEWQHLLGKLAQRNPVLLQRWQALAAPDPHPLFVLQPGPAADWERMPAPSSAIAAPAPAADRAAATTPAAKRSRRTGR